MQTFDTAAHAPDAIRAALTARDTAQDAEAEKIVRAILDDVKARGDAAVLDYTRRFDWPDAMADGIQVPDPYMGYKAAWDDLQPELRDTLIHAEVNISDFHSHERGLLQSWVQFKEAMWHAKPLGMYSYGQMLQPIGRVGAYIPGGKAIYPSTVLMALLPASCAGVENFVICTPSNKEGQISPTLEAVIHEVGGNFLGDTQVFKIGGAQAIAAMAYGTETVPKCDVIVGPGNKYVNIAKRLVYGEVGIDMLAGPSEVAIVADAGANPAFVAADLLAQTEHGHDNKGVLFCSDADTLQKCQNELKQQRAELSRQDILLASGKNLIFVKTNSVAESLDLCNVLAPEHLELMVREPLAVLPLVKNAGAVLLGDHTSAPLGDYWAGPSHTLPTAGAARFSSPLSVATFMKRTSVIYYSAEAAAAAAEDVARFAEAEGFDAHAHAARLRKPA